MKLASSLPSRRRAAFTLIEILCVLAIIVLLAAVAAKNVMESIKTARRDAEVASMGSLADAFRASIIDSKSIPAAANWHTGVFANLAIAPNKVTNTTAGTRRAFLYDPAFRVGTNTTSVPPYIQGNNGSLQPAAPRAVLLSSMYWALPTLGTDATTFSNLWATPRYGVPDGAAWDSWGTSCPDLHIERLDLRDLFACVVLENLDSSNAAPYSMESGVNTSVPAGTRRQMWVLKTSVLNLNYTNNTLQAREYVTEDVSYTYEYGAWGRYARYGPNSGAGWFGVMTDRFLAAAQRGTAQTYSKQQWVADAMCQFLYNFGQYSLVNFPATNGTPSFVMSCAATNALITFGNDLIR